MSKEAIYDAEISPLMKQVIEICQKHGIAMIANFACPNDEDKDLQALTMLPDENNKHPKNHEQALQCIRGSNGEAVMLTTTHANGAMTVTAVL